MAIAFAGNPVATILSYPISSLFCYSQIDHGWPLIFYAPGELKGEAFINLLQVPFLLGLTSFIWVVFFFFFTSNSPDNHPRISVEEKEYLQIHSCINKATGSQKIKRPPVPWKAMLVSVPVHALWFAHFVRKLQGGI